MQPAQSAATRSRHIRCHGEDTTPGIFCSRCSRAVCRRSFCAWFRPFSSHTPPSQACPGPCLGAPCPSQPVVPEKREHHRFSKRWAPRPSSVAEADCPRWLRWDPAPPRAGRTSKSDFMASGVPGWQSAVGSDERFKVETPASLHGRQAWARRSGRTAADDCHASRGSHSASSVRRGGSRKRHARWYQRTS